MNSGRGGGDFVLDLEGVTNFGVILLLVTFT